MIDWRYSLTILAALALCSFLLRRSQTSLPLPHWQKFSLALGAFCGAMIGARLPFVLSDWSSLLDGSAWLGHGKTILCGIVGGYLGVEMTKWSLDIHIKTGDTFAAPVALAVAVGRLGCYQAGCCYGTVSDLPWAVVFPQTADLQPRHPTQLYEAGFHLFAAVVLWELRRRGRLRGQQIKLYILSYLVYRFLTEFIRPEATLWLGLTGYQWAVFPLSGLFVWLWLRDRRGMLEAEARTAHLEAV